MLKRSLTTSARAASFASTSTRSAPLRRTKDPLLSAANAQHFVLPSGSHFIIRSPPSSLPPAYPIPQHSSASSSSPASTQSSSTPFFASSPTPFVTTSPTEHLLPPSRAPTVPGPTLSAADLASLHALRQSDPQFWTRGKLAAKFGVSQKVVGTLGWGEGEAARRAESDRAEQILDQRERKEGAWGWKKAIAREERRRRRAMW